MVLRVRATDTAAGWLVRISNDPVTTVFGNGAAGVDCEVAGRAGDLYLALCNRGPVDGLTITGDADVLDLFLDRVHIRWS